MKKLLLTLCLLGGLSLHALADTISQTITINGVEVTGKSVTAIDFEGDEATLTYSDGSAETAPIEEINILLSYGPNTPTATEEVRVFTFNGIVGGQLRIGGLEEGTAVQVFDLTGKTVASGNAAEGQVSIDITALGRGAYVARAGKQAIKFIKK